MGDHVDRGEENFEQQLPRDRKAAAGEKRGASNTGGPTASDAGVAGGGTDISSSPPERSRLQEFVKDFASARSVAAIARLWTACQVVCSRRSTSWMHRCKSLPCVVLSHRPTKRASTVSWSWLASGMCPTSRPQK